MGVRIVDHSFEVLRKISENERAAVQAMGIKAVELIMDQMKSGYGRPIRKTGNLMNDVRYEQAPTGEYVNVGNTLDYAVHVHEGTRKMNGRAYIKDALVSGADELEDAAMQYMKRGFD